MNPFEFITANKVICEVGAAHKLAQYCQELEISRLMLVTDSGIVQTGMADPLVAEIEKAGISVFLYSDVEADPPESLVLASVEVAKSEKIDGVVGLGGGSSMDVAKLIAVLATSEQPLAEMYGIGNIRGGRLPLIQVPTTAGTGSEVTPTSIITTGATTKTGVISKQLLPDIAILDAELTVGLPPHVTAATGIDAMVHAIEAFTTRHKKNVYSDMLARQALVLMSANISEAVHNGGNLEARSNMLLGAMMAGQSFANAPVAAVHALAYPLGGHYHIPHGLSNSLVLPHVLRFNASTASVLYAELLPFVSHGRSVAGSSAGCDAFIDHMDQLIDDVNLPKTLREMKIAEEDLPMLADDAMLQQRLLVNNPREVSRDDALAIYRAAY
ncbi:probable iron-containing alcohol dehydrogenase [marine gamma proteobacterium HTCC2143]|jgi:alcohol dehydrogenase class IV|uniref:Probable iron-containing alcohol dehydrogenase n=1 Tax=marine gamma proteobacterium HTCC2143 TaxID=247633 RepID=A0YH41_9GAMM|nr:probable iron-containing alcohol dehydrogenase [marine gamma proteobacterium HTCC2143]